MVGWGARKGSLARRVVPPAPCRVATVQEVVGWEDRTGSWARRVALPAPCRAAKVRVGAGWEDRTGHKVHKAGTPLVPFQVAQARTCCTGDCPASWGARQATRVPVRVCGVIPQTSKRRNEAVPVEGRGAPSTLCMLLYTSVP